MNYRLAGIVCLCVAAAAGAGYFYADACKCDAAARSLSACSFTYFIFALLLMVSPLRNAAGELPDIDMDFDSRIPSSDICEDHGSTGDVNIGDVGGMIHAGGGGEMDVGGADLDSGGVDIDFDFCDIFTCF